VPKVGLGLDGFAAEDSGGAELCSLAPPEVSVPAAELLIEFVVAAPEEGGAELCSFAPPDVSAPPEGGVRGLICSSWRGAGLSSRLRSISGKDR
jgi:hypothetical protein